MLPQNVNPMLCRLVRDSFSRPGWIYEVKWDGFQTLAEVGADGVRLTSRNQNSFKKRFGEVAKALERLKHDAVLEGEIVALDEDQHSRFESVVRSQRTAERSAGLSCFRYAVSGR